MARRRGLNTQDDFQERYGLWGLIRPRIETAVLGAIADGPDTVDNAVANVLEERDVRRRVSLSKHLELMYCQRRIQESIAEAHKVGAKLKQVRGVMMGGKVARNNRTAAKYPALDSTEVETRLGSVTPDVVHSLLSEVSEAVIDAASVALASTAAAIRPDATPPTDGQLAEWIAARECPADTLGDVGDRVGALLGAAVGEVAIVAWFYGQLVFVRDGRTDLLEAGHAVEMWAARGKGARNPLAPIVRAWLATRPVHARAVADARSRIIPAGIYQVNGDDPRAGRLFAPAHHNGGERGQMALPGFGVDRLGAVTPALPVAWYDLGGKPQKGGPAPLGLRLMVMALRALPLLDRDGRPRRLEFTLNDFKCVFAPQARRRSAKQMQTAVESAAEVLDSIEARLPTDTGLWRLVDVRRLPRWDVEPDDVLTLDVALPDGIANGPPLPPKLDEYGVTSGATYRGALNVAAHLWEPGRTHAPRSGRRGGWGRVYDPDRYPVLTDADALALVFPTGIPTRNRAQYVGRAWAALRQLEADGEIRIERRRVLPPFPPAGDAG